MIQNLNFLECLIAQLNVLKYNKVTINDKSTMLANLQSQLEIHNNVQFSSLEFENILKYLNTVTPKNRTRILHQKYQIKRDSGELLMVRFLETESWDLNYFQFSKIVIEEKKRSEVTLLINGLPMIHIELREPKLSLIDAFFQVNRYDHNFYDADFGLFQYVQIFVISNGRETKYFFNTQHQSFQRTYNLFINDKIWDFTELFVEFTKPINMLRVIKN